MTVDTDFVPGILRGRFLEHASRVIGEQRWADARTQHGLMPGRDVPDHPLTISREHYVWRARIRSMARSSRDAEHRLTSGEFHWYPVGGCVFESYGDLRYRIRMLFALPAISAHGTFDDAVAALRNKRTEAGQRQRMVNFRAVGGGIRIERYSVGGHPVRSDIRHEVLGFELVQDSGRSQDSLWCPGGLGQAREILGEINGSSELIGPGLVENGGGLINHHEYRYLAGRDFDRGDGPAADGALLR